MRREIGDLCDKGCDLCGCVCRKDGGRLAEEPRSESVGDRGVSEWVE
jgi:hypothetical protein